MQKAEAMKERRYMEALTMKEVQQVSLEILHQVAEVCEAHNWRYSLVYGTLIGAIRHQGYIPWDDDVDIMMPRKDYDVFLNYMHEHRAEYPNLKVFDPKSCKDYPYMIARVSDERYGIKMENEKPYGMGVFIDIYPYDGLGNTKQEAVSFGRKGDLLSSLCYQATREHFAMETTTTALKKALKFPTYLVSKCIGKGYFQKQLAKLEGVKSYDEAQYVGCAVWLSGGEKDIFKREWFDDLVLVPFEQYQFRVPKAYDAVLRHIYGDYMQLPPEKDRIGHHYYTVYRK